MTSQYLNNKIFQLNFLDYKIINTGNSDGFIVFKEKKFILFSEYNLGNYTTLKSAKDAAFKYFLIMRPKDFHTQVFHRIKGTKTSHEWFRFIDVCKREKIKIPSEIRPSTDMSCTIVTSFSNKEYEKFMENNINVG